MKTALEMQVACLRADGALKAHYPDKRTAKAAARRNKDKYKMLMRPYACPTCGSFHLTKKHS